MVYDALRPARHAYPNLTANTYAWSRLHRLAEETEKVGEKVLSGSECAKYVLPKVVGAQNESGNSNCDNVLPIISRSGGGGNRTRRLSQFSVRASNGYAIVSTESSTSEAGAPAAATIIASWRLPSADPPLQSIAHAYCFGQNDG
jgi:hypothetical protein